MFPNGTCTDTLKAIIKCINKIGKALFTLPLYLNFKIDFSYMILSNKYQQFRGFTSASHNTFPALHLRNFPHILKTALSEGSADMCF